MTDLVFGPATVLGGTGNPWLTGVSDLDVVTAAGGPYLYATSGPGGGVVVYRLAASGALDEVDRYALTGFSAAGIENRLVMTPDDVALVTGVGTTGLWGIGTAAGGQLSARVDLGTALPRDLAAVTAATLGGKDYLFGLRLGSEAVSVWEIAASGRLSAVSLPGGGSLSAGPVLTDIASITVGGGLFLLATSAGGDALICWRVGANGVPAEVARLDNETGLGITDPMALTTAVVDGVAHAVFVSAGSGTLTVARIGSGGSLTVTDHVMDDMDSRFQGASVVESITIAGRTYVVAAGADDGITLFELLPGGRLLDRATLADSAGRTLDNVAAVALAEQGGDLQVLVTSATEPGITRVAVDLVAGQVLTAGSGNATLTGGAGADLIAGRAGNDRLDGGAGNDVLMDGAGEDRLTGGSGRDVFVMAADGQTDTISDFDPAQDRLDLSGWANLRGTSQLTVTATATGAEIRHGSEILILQGAGGQSLSPAVIRGMDIAGVSRLGPGFVAGIIPAMTFQGGAEADRLVASDRADRLFGGGGADSLRGGHGRDLIQGGEDDDSLWGEEEDDQIGGEAGQDSLWGGAGDDSLWGGAGSDTAWGEDGADVIEGETGRDWLYGGVGDDIVRGGEEGDLLWGEAGSDRLSGDAGGDSAFGGDGADTLWGGGDHDVLRGDAGNDLLLGEEGADVLSGGAGSDMLQGGAGDDTLDAGSGNDQADGGEGDDAILGGDGNDGLRGEAADDRLAGGDGSDSLWGGAGDDTLSGEGDGDRLWGGGGGDLLRADAGQDEIWGGEGGDTLLGGSGDDLMAGDAGNDLLLGEADRDRLSGGEGNDRVEGGDDSDSLWGGAGWDQLLGGNGADRLWGEAAADTLWGGAGNDTLWGGSGPDRLTGGAGSDRFVFQGGQDVIVDFRNNSDEISLARGLWPGARPTLAAILDAAVVTAAGTRLEMPGGHSLLIQGLSRPGLLSDDIVFV